MRVWREGFWRPWKWEFYHSAYGWAGGASWTRHQAEAKLLRVTGEFFMNQPSPKGEE